MNKNSNLLTQAKQFAAANTSKISTAITKFKSSKTAKYIAGFGVAVTKSDWWKASASVLLLSSAVAYTTTIGVSAWLAEKILNLPVNLLRIATGLLTLPFSVTERIIRKAPKSSNKPTFTTKPYYLVVRVMKAWKVATNYVAALYVRTAMSYTFRAGIRAAFIYVAASAILSLIAGASIGSVLAGIATTMIPLFLAAVIVGMVFVALNDVLKMNEKVANVFNAIFKIIFVTPFVLIGKALSFVFTVIGGRKIKKANATQNTSGVTDQDTQRVIDDLKAQRDCAIAERDFAIQRAEEAEEATLIFRGEAEKLQKKANGYIKKDNRRERRKSGDPSKHTV